jgi:hypothetical protein
LLKKGEKDSLKLGDTFNLIPQLYPFRLWADDAQSEEEVEPIEQANQVGQNALKKEQSVAKEVPAPKAAIKKEEAQTEKKKSEILPPTKEEPKTKNQSIEPPPLEPTKQEEKKPKKPKPLKFEDAPPAVEEDDQEMPQIEEKKNKPKETRPKTLATPCQFGLNCYMKKPGLNIHY